MALPQEKDPLQSNQPNPGQTRRVSNTINNDFSYLRDQKAANGDKYAPTNEKFTARAYEDNVLGPVGLGRNEAANKTRLSPNEIDTPYTEGDEAETPPSIARRAVRSLGRSLIRKNPAPIALTAARRARISAVNLSAISWLTWLWLFVQLPFAILAAAGLGMVGIIGGLTAGEGGLMAFLLRQVVNLVDLLAGIIGTSLAEAAIGLYMISSFVIMAQFILTALFLSLQYMLAGAKPLSGTAAGLKIGAFLLALIGSAMPLANMIPFIALWMIALWLFPR